MATFNKLVCLQHSTTLKLKRLNSNICAFMHCACTELTRGSVKGNAAADIRKGQSACTLLRGRLLHPPGTRLGHGYGLVCKSQHHAVYSLLLSMAFTSPEERLADEAQL